VEDRHRVPVVFQQVHGQLDQQQKFRGFAAVEFRTTEETRKFQGLSRKRVRQEQPVLDVERLANSEPSVSVLSATPLSGTSSLLTSDEKSFRTRPDFLHPAQPQSLISEYEINPLTLRPASSRTDPILPFPTPATPRRPGLPDSPAARC
jgi:hypothetical protein